MKYLLLFLGVWVLVAHGPQGHAADASLLGLIKLQQFEQTPGAGPVVAVSNGYSFQAFVVCSTNYSVTNATVSFKQGSATAVRVLQSVTNGLALRFEEKFPTQSALDAAYPAGSGFSVVEYTNTLFTAQDGVRKVNLNFWLLPPFAAISAPGTPSVANLVEASAIDGAGEFVLRWNSLGSALTLVQLTILDRQSNVVFATPIPLTAGALNGTSNSVLIPARTLPVGSAFEAHLTALNPGLPNTNTYAGAWAVAALAKDTVFPMTTLSVAAPRLSIAASLEDGIELFLTGALNHEHEIQASEAFGPWRVVLSTNLSTGAMRWKDPEFVKNRHRYYRAVVVR
jgi:hypothetical protein